MTEILAICSRALLRLFGWQLHGDSPEAKKLIIIGAPHTSNWDFPLTLLALAGLRLRFNWVAKKASSDGHSGLFFRKLAVFQSIEVEEPPFFAISFSALSKTIHLLLQLHRKEHGPKQTTGGQASISLPCRQNSQSALVLSTTIRDR